MKKLMIIAGLLVLFASCYNDKADVLYPLPTDPCDTTNVTMSYSANVKPVMLSSCAVSGCHDASTVAGGYDFNTYTAVQSAILNNKFVESITHQSGASPMPQGGAKLPECTIKQIVKWVNQGYPNN